MCAEGVCAVLMNGFAVIVLGFVAFGVVHTHTGRFMPWQWCAALSPLERDDRHFIFTHAG